MMMKYPDLLQERKDEAEERFKGDPISREAKPEDLVLKDAVHEDVRDDLTGGWLPGESVAEAKKEEPKKEEPKA